MSKVISKKTTLEIPKDEINPQDEYTLVFVNGKRIQIKKDEEVEVSPIVKDILNESKHLARRGNKKIKLALDEQD